MSAILMKRIIHILIFLIFPIIVKSQNEYLERLSLLGAVPELGISPSEEIWVATNAGNVYYTKQIGELWHLGPFGSLDPFNYSSGKTFERINFFSENNMMISGFIQEGGKEDFVYRSDNHGLTWDKVVFGKSSWIDAAYINNNGKAWMSGSSQLIYYTKDNGETWVAFDKVEQTGNLRFSTIHFAKDEKIGLFGSFWDVLYRTIDNCQSWEKLPTPLSQKKYKLLSKEDRPDIRKIRIFGNYYIINQQGKVFFTKSDSINWTFLPNIIDFEITEDDNLYTINQNLKVELYNSNFSKTWSSEQKIEASLRAISVKNNKLFVLSYESIYKISPKEFIVSDIYTNEIHIKEPYLKLNFVGEEYGFENKDILCFDKEKKQWYRFMTLDFSISNATIFKDYLIVADANFNQYYSVDNKAKTINKFELPSSLFSNCIVKEVHFENESQGCFHSNNEQKIYIHKDSSFVVDKKSNSSKYLSQAENEIRDYTIKGLVDIIDSSRFMKVSLEDLDISENDILQFKKFIDNEEKRIIKTGFDRLDFENLYSFLGENTDFGFYKAVADSIHTISDADINNAFWQAYGNWSTTTNWRRIVFLFQDGKKLIVENSDDKPNYLYSPWLVDYEGLKFRSNSIVFGQKIDEITNGQFFLNVTRDKNYAIFKIADYMYRKKLNEK
ncbi:MAG: hypothetical protein CVU05_11820 [Bacteroidetes bacterium HGW-Bacteroidetes-21]|jgi:hypothetical protein|nr:MAG: hypothetical protein CVU05_11820 [Bacteroidetes bacterium HGW-Bacteroidetes-21]